MPEESNDSRIERRIAKAREALLFEPDPARKRRLLKKIRRLRARTEAPEAPRSVAIPREATRLRHRWVK